MVFWEMVEMSTAIGKNGIRNYDGGLQQFLSVLSKHSTNIDIKND